MLSLETPEGRTLGLEGSLDSAAVASLERILSRASRESPLTLDFSKVRDVDWFALATLGLLLAKLPEASVIVIGYSEQQARLLAYLGVSRDCCASRAVPPKSPSPDDDVPQENHDPELHRAPPSP